MDLIERLTSASWGLTVVIVGIIVTVVLGSGIQMFGPCWPWFNRHWYSIRTALLICLVVFSVGQIGVSQYLVHLGG